jgi:hypothetical protein
MKTTTLILAALIFGIFTTTSLNAESKFETRKTEKQLTKTIEAIFQDTPLEDFMDSNSKSVLNVKFTINNNDEIEVSQVEGDNPYFVKYAKSKLAEMSLKADPGYEHKNYSITLVFVLR